MTPDAAARDDDNDNNNITHDLTFLNEISLDDLLKDATNNKQRHYMQQDIQAANRVWTITVVSNESRYDTDILFVALGAMIILLSSIVLVFWVRHNDNRTRKYNMERAISEQEKAALILENARQATKSERELNDFIAHEVRNPGTNENKQTNKQTNILYKSKQVHMHLDIVVVSHTHFALVCSPFIIIVAAAMAACNFVKTAIQQEDPLRDPESLELAREDVKIIDNSLHFVNDLLRNMLDMHRATSKQLHVDMTTPVDLLHDVLEPVGGMLYQQRGSKVNLIVECPENLIIHVDCLRLKQVLLNLGRNSTKFIQEGFIRLKAEEVVLDGNNNVRLYVDDSGCGIPAEKRELLFAKFQESLDVLSQGTVSQAK